MTDISIDPIALIRLQSELRREGYDVEQIPDRTDWVTTQLGETNGMVPAEHLAEQYPHDTGLQRALNTVLEACPICGETDCDRGVAWVGADPIHADRHPEARAERAMDRGRFR